MPNEPTSWVAVAHILGFRGNKGEVAAVPLSNQPGRWAALKSATLVWPDGKEQPVDVESAWVHKDRVVLKFRGVGSISEAEALKGADVCIRREERMPLPPGEHYLSDLMGCLLIDGRSGEPVGEVVGWQEMELGGPPLLQVQRGRDEVLVPFVPSICGQVDVDARRIVADLPEGLLDVNRAE